MGLSARNFPVHVFIFHLNWEILDYIGKCQLFKNPAPLGIYLQTFFEL